MIHGWHSKKSYFVKVVVILTGTRTVLSPDYSSNTKERKVEINREITLLIFFLLPDALQSEKNIFS